MAKEIADLSSKAIEKLGLSPAVRDALVGIQAEIAAGYRDGFVEMVQAIQRQASALDRLQTTLNLLVEHLAPHIKGQVPVALRVAGPDETPDISSALVTADPIGAGYTMTQATLAQALGLSQADVSVLLRAFKLSEDGQSAVVVRTGKQNIVNYHPRAIERFRQLVAAPPSGLNNNEKSALKRVVTKLVLSSVVPSTPE